MSSFSSLQKHIDNFPSAHLVVVAKNQSCTDIQALIDAGANTIAFSRVQEAQAKLPHLQFTGEVHGIGHLQKNKVRTAITIFSLIHSVDSLALAEKISSESKKIDITTRILLQVNIDYDERKQGISPKDISRILPEIALFSHISVCGLMMIGKQDASEAEIRNSFVRLREMFQQIQAKNIFGESFVHLSMGMSNDYQIALEEGATLVRVGRMLFGELNL